jgi:hypothetical protein
MGPSHRASKPMHARNAMAPRAPRHSNGHPCNASHAGNAFMSPLGLCGTAIVHNQQ